MKQISIIITGDELAHKISAYLEKRKIKFINLMKCTGYSAKFSLMEFLGANETQKTLLLFQATSFQWKAISRFIRKYFNYKNNGIMFAINGEERMSDMILYVAIVNIGKGEKVVEVIREKASAGATVLEGRGNGNNTEEFFGVEIGSGKEIVLSAIYENSLSAIKLGVKKAFKDENSDLISFALPISNFDKLHQDKK